MMIADCLLPACRYIQFHALFFLIKLHIEMTIAELIAKIAKTTAASGPRSLAVRGRRRRDRPRSSAARFSCSVTWHQLLGLDSPGHPVGEPLADDEDEVRDAADVEMGRLAGTPSVSRNQSRTLERSDSNATTEVDCNDCVDEIDKQWTSETRVTCGRRGLTERSQAQGWTYGPKSARRRKSI